MAERSLTFSGESVVNIRNGLKTMTRRVIVPQPVLVDGQVWEWPRVTERKVPSKPWVQSDASWANGIKNVTVAMARFCPYGVVGDRIWVRETFALVKEIGLEDETSWETWKGPLPKEHPEGWVLEFRATEGALGGPWRSPRFMPRWASRITLELTDIRVERIRKISADDMRAEGTTCALDYPGMTHCHCMPCVSLRQRHMTKWNNVNSKRGYPWSMDPFVWVLEFKMWDWLLDKP